MSPVVIELLELRTNDPTKVVRFLQVEKFADGSGYRCDLTVLSRGFSCTRPFYFDDASLSVALKTLRAMAAGAKGACVIHGQWEEDCLRFETDHLGHVRVSGELFEHSELAQSLKFAFCTDQTILSPLVRELEVLQSA